MFGMAHRKPWRSKSTKDGKKSVLRSPMISKAGHCVAVDQMVSAQPGLVPQDKGQMTRAQIWGCTVFVDYTTSYVHVVLMRDQSIESKLAAKQELEDKCAEKVIKVEHYHADNGRLERGLQNERPKIDILWCRRASLECNRRTQNQGLDTDWMHSTPPCHAILARINFADIMALCH
eukprot:CCRYP_001842-RA/>CCRYP_001842-RA protein AED:0.43 eAED:0.63 QI:0/0/0/1/0/0/2/0/175